MHRLGVKKSNLVDSGSEMMQRRLGGGEELPVCPKPRRLGAAIPDFLKLPFKCHKHSQSNVEGRSEILNMIAGKSDEGRESLCSGCSPPCYSGSPPGRADNPLVHDVQFVNQMFTVHANQVFR